MAGLTVLGLWGDVEQLFKSYPYLAPIFGALRSLRTLSMNVGGERCYEMIKALQSQSELCFVVIYLMLTGPSDLSLAARYHPVLMLQQSACSLTELAYSSFHTEEELVFSPTIIYPNLHTLQLCDRFSLHPLPFIKVFPNLEYLHVYRTQPRRYAGFDFLQSRREANLALQPPSKDGTPFGWKHLQRYSGPVAGLWAPGLACRIPELFFEDTLSEHPPLALADVLAYARPECVTITFEGHLLTDVLGSGFLAALRSDGASGLGYLAFILDLMVADRGLDIGGVLTDLGSALSRLPQLSDLRFSVRDIGLSESTAASPASASPATAAPDHAAPPPAAEARASSQDSPGGPAEDLNRPPPSVAERTLDAFDTVAFARDLWTSIPTLQHAIIAVERPGRYGPGVRAACMGHDSRLHSEYMRGMQPIYLNAWAEMRGPASAFREMFAGAVRMWGGPL